jgi:D-aminoacyl-tRNA deacylase
MIALLQRVSQATVRIGGEPYGSIGRGLLVFLGLEKQDTRDSGERLLRKVLDYRVFPDAQQRMNQSLRDISGEILLVSQFTLAADTQSGLRPSFSAAMPPVEAEILYESLVAYLRQQHGSVATGKFGADMQVSLENEGPVTFLLRS